VKEGEILPAKIVSVEYPVTGQYGEQVEWHVELDNGYQTTIWMSYYKEPSDKSFLGMLSIAFMDMIKSYSYDTVNDVLAAIKEHGKVYVRCAGFREWEDKIYPKFKIVPTKFPTIQRQTLA